MMKSRRINGFIVFILTVLLAGCSLQEQDGLFTLDGEWEYQKGFSKSWLKNPPEQWQKKKYPLKFRALDSFKQYQGYITARKKLPPELAQGKKTWLQLKFFSHLVADVSQFYINKHKIGQLGSVAPYESGAFKQLTAVFASKYLKKKKSNYLYVVLYSEGQRPLAIEGGNIIIGSEPAVSRVLENEVILTVFFLAIYLAVGAYHLLLGFRRPQDSYNWVFGVFCFIVSFYWTFSFYSRDLVYTDADLRASLQFSSLALCNAFLVLFIDLFLERKVSIVTRIFIFYQVAVSTFIFLVPYNQKLYGLTAIQFSMPPALLYYGGYLFTKHLRRKNKDAFYLAAGALIFILSVINDLLWSLGIVQTYQVTDIGFSIFILGIAGTLANKFVRVQKQVEELNQNLERKVEERTRQLKKSLGEVNALKEQQDGDYYLTSLLIKPLGGNHAHSDNFTIQYFLKQKKKFSFKKWKSEIGGDLVATHNIRLQEKDYVVVMNGDAMGKSMQGAGGALVFGTVFKSVVARTQLSSYTRNKSPERWLKDCFVELQDIFESFEGSMLISSVIALFDTANGFMYYINAEHPFTVLYRDKKAAFIEDSTVLHKIGWQGLSEQITIRTFQMFQNDKIIMGSDGRDDIETGKAEDTRIINEDENLFLRCIEQADGDIDQLPAEIQANGQFTDDCSLVSVQYNGNKQKESGEVFEPGILSQVKQAIEEKDFSRALPLLLSYFNQHPGELQVLEQAIDCAHELGQIETAIDCAERLRLRQPHDHKNLAKLASLHRKAGNVSRAVELEKMIKNN